LHVGTEGRILGPVKPLLSTLLVAALALAASAGAQPRLVAPERPIQPLEAHEARLRLVFREAFAPGVRLRALVTPSFETEYVVAIRAGREGDEILALRPAQPIFAYSWLEMLRSGKAGVIAPGGGGTRGEIERLQSTLPRDPAELPLARCVVPIEPALAALIAEAWGKLLRAIRAGETQPTGLDGTGWRFELEAAGGTLAGATWSPKRGTPPARLARLAEAMREHCEAPGAAGAARLIETARAVITGRGGGKEAAGPRQARPAPGPKSSRRQARAEAEEAVDGMAAAFFAEVGYAWALAEGGLSYAMPDGAAMIRIECRSGELELSGEDSRGRTDGARVTARIGVKAKRRGFIRRAGAESRFVIPLRSDDPLVSALFAGPRLKIATGKIGLSVDTAGGARLFEALLARCRPRTGSAAPSPPAVP
jgi:hypothetical protein